MRYAAQTNVSTEQTRSEIEKLLTKYGASGFMYGWQNAAAVIGFEFNGKRIRFNLPLPDREDRAFTHTGYRRARRTQDQARAAWELACRQRWRALLLCIRAKLEAVETKISTFENEFLAHIILPDGHTIGDLIVPQITEAYETKRMPPLLGGHVEP